MADSSSGTSTPTSVIASEFIRAYYNALSNEPQSLYAFYEEDSAFSRFDEGEISDTMIPAQGQLAIHEAVSSIPYHGCKVRIETTDAHDSSFGSVIVIVTGIIVLVGQPHPRTFVQTFVLQPLVSGSPHFYVRNDILRYTSKITPTVAPVAPAPATPVVNHVPEHTPQQQSHSRPSSPKKQTLAAPASPQAAPLRAPPSPVKPVAEPIVTPEPLPVRPVSPVVPKSPQRTPEPAVVASPPPEESPVAAAAAAAPAPAAAAPAPVENKPQRVRKVKREKPTPAPAPAAEAAQGPAAATPAAAPVEVKQEQKAPAKVVEKKAVAKPVVQQPPRPSTWASRLFNAAKDGPAGAKPAEETTETPVVETTTTPHVNGDATAAAPAQPATAEQPARKPRSTKRASSGKSENYKSQELHSLWVNNIPSTVTQPELTTLFSAFGSLRPIRLVSGKTYCFVDYYTAEGADNALAARPLRIQGAELSVDKKLVKQTSTTRPTSAKQQPSSTPTTTTTAPLDDGFQKPTAGRSRAYKQRVASENKAAAAQQQAATGPTQAKKSAPTNGAPRK